MISVVIETLNDEARLVACLAPLVPGSMAGLLRELIVVDRGSVDQTLEIAEDAGARIVRADRGVGAGIEEARGPWVLVLDPVVRLDRGWEAVVQSHIETSREPATFRLRNISGGWLTRLRAPGATAVLFLKETGHSGGGGFDARRLRGLRGRRLDAGGAI